MKTFAEILTERWRKSPGYKLEREAEFKNFLETDEVALDVAKAVEEYKDQFVPVPNATPITPLEQLAIPFEGAYPGDKGATMGMSY